MALFPVFVNLEGVQGLIVGTGRNGTEKTEKLKPFHPELTVIAEEEFRESMLDVYPAFVIAAGEDTEQNHRIAKMCRERRIPVNVVDDPLYCDFVFPSLIVRGNLSVGVCTNGASPATGMLLRKKIEEQIPDRIEEILDFLQEKRPAVHQAFADKNIRFSIFRQLSEICLSLNRPLTEEEFLQFIESYT